MKTPHLLFLLQAVHTLIVVVCVAGLAPMVFYALTGEGLVIALGALALPVIVVIGLLLNRGTCILQTLGKRMTGTTDGWARDVLFLPESWALKVVPVMVPVFVITGVGMVIRWGLAG